MEPIHTVSGAVSVLDRADVDTDQIIPKQFLKRIERTGFGEFLFYDWAKQPDWDLPANPILATGPNFGCGSSREHAPWALEDYGFKAIVAESFADIFFSNCTKIGLLPVRLPDADVRAVMEAGEAEIDLEALEVRFDGRAVPFELDDQTRHRLLNGLDDIALTLQEEDAIAAYEADRQRPARSRRACEPVDGPEERDRVDAARGVLAEGDEVGDLEAGPPRSGRAAPRRAARSRSARCTGRRRGSGRTATAGAGRARRSRR